MFVTVGCGWFFDRLVSRGDNTRRYVETTEIGSKLVLVVVGGAFGECQRLSCPGGGGVRSGGGGITAGNGNGRSAYRHPNNVADGNALSNADGAGNGNGRSFRHTDGAADCIDDADCQPYRRAHGDNGR